MALKPGVPNPPADPRHRRVPQAGIEDMLLLAGCVFAVEAGREAEARGEISQSLERCIAAGLGYRSEGPSGRQFDPAEVLNFITWAGLSGLDDFWLEHIVPTGRALFAELDAPCGGTSKFQVKWRRTFDLHHLRAGARVRLRLPVPLQSAHLGTVKVIPEPPAESDAEVRILDGRLDVKLTVADPRTTIGATLEFETPGDGAVDEADGLDPAQMDIYLRPIEGPIRVTPALKALAHRLATPARPLETVTTFWNHMIEILGFGVVRYDDPPGVSENGIGYGGWYDCQIGAAMLATLCRAMGIPARIVSGHVLYRLAPTPHYWTEVWIAGRGWLGFDFIAWGLSVAGRDQEWKDRFAGRAQPRMITQRLPFDFTGPMSVHFPAAWQMLPAKTPKGAQIAYTDISDGSSIYVDQIEVRRLA